jgi:hypothetical protein
MTNFTLNWVADGPDAWKASLGSGRVARIGKKNGKFIARITGGDPGAENYGGYATLEAAQARFEPGWVAPPPEAPVPSRTARLAATATPLPQRAPGPPVNVAKVFAGT